MKSFSFPLLSKRALLLFFVLAQFAMAAGTSAAAVSANASSLLTAAEKAAYMLPDGTLPVFCAESDADGKAVPHVMCKGCLCDCTGGLLSSQITVRAVFAVLSNAWPDGRFIGEGRFLPPQARAPPSV